MAKRWGARSDSDRVPSDGWGDRRRGDHRGQEHGLRVQWATDGQAGINDPADRSVAVVHYMPAAITVRAGTTVRWVWDGTVERHSVTFFPPGQSIPAPGSDTKLYASTLPSGPFDGSAFVNSGLQPLGPTPASRSR